jgi:hypothetical protein
MKFRPALSRTVVLFTLLALAVLPLPAQADFAAGKASDFITNLSRGDFQKAYQMVDSNLGFQTTPEKWKATWNSLTGKAGSFVEFRKNEVSPKTGYSVVVQVCKFEKGLVDLHVAVNNQGQIAGFAIKDHKAAPAPQAAAPAAPADATSGGA